MVPFAAYVNLGPSKPRLIFSRINGKGFECDDMVDETLTNRDVVCDLTLALKCF